VTDEQDDISASERTDPDATWADESVVANKLAPEPAPEPEPEPASTPAPGPRVDIPAPKLEGAATRRGLDAVAAIAMSAFVLVGGLLVFGYAQALVPAAEAQLGAACRPLTPVEKTGPAPALELEDLAGNPTSLDEFRGKFVVLNFWATWCEPCTREWPDLDLLATRLAERDDIAVVAVSLDTSNDDIIPYMQRMGLAQTKVRVLRSKSAEAHKLFGSDKIPDTYFVSPTGELQALFVNVREWGRPKAVRCVEASAG
jgi:thiol-disulfide isomerase/thioredoxin